MSITLKSAYLPYDSKDGARYLAETLWPSGVDTYDLSPYLWVQELAPSYDLKERAVWHKWTPEQFREEYRKELQAPQRSSWLALIVAEARKKGITLLHHSHKKESRILPEDTSVFYLKEFLEAELIKGLKLSKAPKGSNQDAQQGQKSKEDKGEIYGKDEKKS
jgi:uncharacterized protein YeaO (DUF488 family)